MIGIGLMSGTSADSIDAACVRLEGAPPRLDWELLSFITLPMTAELRQDIFKAFRPETGTVDHLCQLNFTLGEWFARASLEAVKAANLTPDRVDFIGSHGQTVWHIPPNTDQVVPFVDNLLLSHPTLSRAVQNIGGIGNVTWLPAGSKGEAFGFDTGPGNMLLDRAAEVLTDGQLRCDMDGRMAFAGQVQQHFLQKWMEEEPYFNLQPPKSTGRELFGVQRCDVYLKEMAGLCREDILATLTAFTARSTAEAYKRFLPALPDEVLLCGGGARNPAIAAMLQKELPASRIGRTEDAGLPGDSKEAVAFAVLGYETMNRRPGNLPAATGAKYPVILGSITY